jgi:competence protein ComEA
MNKKIAFGIASVMLASIAWAQVELNNASEIELDGLKGLGPTLTREVIDQREKALFQNWSDVMKRVKGIGPKKAITLSEQGLRVQGLGYDRAPIHPLKTP